MGSGIDDAMLTRLEKEHADGISSADILALLEQHGIKFSEASLRKYVQLGLLPRSVRVGRKGKHQGSQGMYPASVVRQILRIKDLMADDLTIEQIQKELLVRGDIEELERVLAKLFEVVGQAAREKKDVGGGRGVAHEIAGAKSLAKELVAKLESIEARLTAREQQHVRVAGGGAA